MEKSVRGTLSWASEFSTSRGTSGGGENEDPFPCHVRGSNCITQLLLVHVNDSSSCFLVHPLQHIWIQSSSPHIFPGSSAGKESACNAGDLGLISGLGRSFEEGKGYPLQYSGLENSTYYIVHGNAKSRTWLNDFHIPSANCIILFYPFARWEA